MPWLRSLVVTLDSLDGLTEAVGRQPRLTELLVYARATTLPAIASESLAALLLEGMDGDAPGPTDIRRYPFILRTCGRPWQ